MKKIGLKGEFMKKVLNKNRLFYAIMFSLIFIVILIMGIVFTKEFILGKNKSVVSKKNLDSLEMYGYTLDENETALYKEEFEKLDIRVGTVLECEVVPKMKKLLKFKIADGLENRTIVSGIAQHYKPEELIGKQVLFIANLAPRQFKNGLVSEGMILSAENFDGTLAVTSLLREVKPGSEVK